MEKTFQKESEIYYIYEHSLNIIVDGKVLREIMNKLSEKGYSGILLNNISSHRFYRDTLLLTTKINNQFIINSEEFRPVFFKFARNVSKKYITCHDVFCYFGKQASQLKEFYDNY